MNINDVVHYYTIKVLNEKHEIIEHLKWDDLRWEVRIKYNWYFKYRAALLQVKYPKFKVEEYWGHELARGKSLQQINKNKLIAKKRKLTEWNNKLDRYKTNWNSLFTIEDDIAYKRAILSINKLEFEIRSLEIQLTNETTQETQQSFS